MRHLQDLPVVILGLGASGLAMARWCARHGAQVTVADTREAPPQLATLQQEVPGAVFIGGPFTAALANGMQAIYRSPGLAPEVLAPVLDEAQRAGLRVGGELDLFAQALADLRQSTAVPESDAQPEPEEDLAPVELSDDGEAPVIAAPAEAVGYQPAVLAITGTNGKTTVTSLTGQLVARAGKTVAVAGNIGPTLLDTLAGHIDASTLPEVWVLELSSFQLDAARGFEPTAAAVLNLTQDHLDWHGSMAAYTAAKARIFGSAAVMVMNADDPAVMALVPQPEVVKGKVKPKPIAHAVTRFSLQAPQQPGDFGLVEENGMAWLVRALPVDETFKLKKGEAVDIHLQRLMPADALRVRGRHNAANALAALSLATTIGCTLAPMLHGLREYAGEPHRVQPIGQVGEVEAYDDSKGTNVGATVAALNGLGADKAPAKLVVILGGDGKGQDFSPLTAPLARHARAVATLGRDAAAIEAVIEGLPFQRFDTLPAAVAWCFEQARGGDAVLLSPACASLDMFRHYAHRAEVFAQAVQALAAERGQV